MARKLEVRTEEFNLLPQNVGQLKEFLQSIPNHAKYMIDTRSDGAFLNTYWIGVNENVEEEPVKTYEIVLPHICVYGKLAHDLITDLNPINNRPFRLVATDTIELSKGFVHILMHNIAECDAPYVICEGWVKEHLQLLQEAAYRFRVPLQDNEGNNFL